MPSDIHIGGKLVEPGKKPNPKGKVIIKGDIKGKESGEIVINPASEPSNNQPGQKNKDTQ